MNPLDFLRTVYLGDRGCMGINLVSYHKRVEVHVDCISRTRSPGLWDYYNDEDIVDGKIVFVDVEQFGLTPPGLLPNDLINELTMIKERTDGMFEFVIKIDSILSDGTRALATVSITARDLHLEDPAKPGVRIR